MSDAADPAEPSGSQVSAPVLPTFFVVGAAKAGTTALHHYLGQHPDVFLPARQEPSFFSFEGQVLEFRGPNGTAASVNHTAVTSLDEYANLYRPSADNQVRGDVSPVYLYWPGTAARIRARVPDARVVVVLRDPVDRAYSGFMHAMREGKEPLGEFSAALRAEPARIAENWGFLWRYADLGRYARQLEEYSDVFPRSNLKVVLYDDFVRDPLALMSELYAFIGVDPSFPPDVSVQHNVSGLPRSRLAYRLTASRGALRPLARLVAPVAGRERLRRWQVEARSRIVRKVDAPPEVFRSLLEELRPDMERTAAITGLDLARWR